MVVVVESENQRNQVEVQKNTHNKSESEKIGQSKNIKQSWAKKSEAFEVEFNFFPLHISFLTF